MNYIKGLNGLRAIAVICVIIEHWFPAKHILKIFPLGSIGVDIFFVLSGFLISSILLTTKENNLISFKSKLHAIKDFVIRRALRIFPIYYLLLLFLYVTSDSEFKNEIVYYITYTSNYFFYFTNDWHGHVAHLWSLAVEEQFYLIWPLLLFFVLRKQLLKLFLVCIIIGTLFPLFLNNYMSFVLTLSCVNAFALGAVLAYIEVYKPDFGNEFKKYLKLLFIPLIVLFIAQVTLFKLPYFPLRIITGLITLNCIRICIDNNEKNVLFRLFSNKVLNFIGMISYGIYLYHCPLPSYWRRFFRVVKIDSPFAKLEINYCELLAQFIFLIVISYISWIIVEKPILKLKKNF